MAPTARPIPATVSPARLWKPFRPALRSLECEPRSGREMERNHKPYELAPDVNIAVKRAMALADESDTMCVIGSIFCIGEARELWAK